MTQKEMVMKLWAAKCNLNKMKIDLEDVANTLRNWQLERIAKGLRMDACELADSVNVMWYAEVLQLAQDNIGRVHERLERDMTLNEVE